MLQSFEKCVNLSYVWYVEKENCDSKKDSFLKKKKQIKNEGKK